MDDAILALVQLEAVESIAHSGEAGTEPFAIGVVHHVVGIHSKVAERVGSSFLRADRGEVERHVAVVAAVQVVDFNRTTDDRVVGGHCGNDIELHAGIAGIHLLLVKRAVEQHLMAAHLHGTCANRLHASERGILGRVEPRLALKRIARFDEREVLDFHWRIASFDYDLAPASAPEPRRLEHCAVASVEHEPIAESAEGFAFPFAAVALEAALDPRILRGAAQRLGPLPAHLAALAALHDCLGVGANVAAKIPENATLLARLHD